MEKRKPNDLSPEQCLAVDTESLCKLLDCGRHTAVQIGDLAHARITMNSRVLWSVQRKGISLRDLMLTESCPPGAQQYTNHREVSIYAKNQERQQRPQSAAR